MQFKDIGDHRQWSYHVKLDKLKELFKDDALIYYSRLSRDIWNLQTTANVRKSGGSERSIYTEEDGLIHQVTFPETSKNTDEMICQLHNKLSGNIVSFQDTNMKDLEEKVESLSQSINKMLKSNYPQSPLRPYPS